MKSIRELTQVKSQLEEALSHVNEALQSDEYAKPFSFKLSNPIRQDEFKHDILKQIIERCENREIGFDPNLTLQHIESEVLDQFNEIVKLAIKGKSIRNLMAIRHELELFMLNDRKKQHEHNLKNVSADLEKLMSQLDEKQERFNEIADNANKVATIGPEDEMKEEAIPGENGATITVTSADKIQPVTNVAVKKKKG